MDERKSKRPESDDVPIIGDYSEAHDTRLRGAAPAAPPPTPPRSGDTRPQRTEQRRRDERWTLDPHDVRRYKRLAGERERKGLPAKFLRYAPVAAILAVAFVVFWNFDSLRGMTVGFSLPTGSFGRDRAEPGDAAAQTDAELAAVSVEAPVVVGNDAALDPVENAAPAPEARTERTPASPPPETDAAQVAEQHAEADSAAADSAAAVEQPPVRQTPVEPETFAFGVARTTASESDAAAAVLILRNGGDRGASSVTWWTTPGTATAGVDYADLGRVELLFPAGAQNRTIRIPIVGDRVAEGPETFSVHLATSDGAAAAQAPVEVVINDDD
jgi:hypothetical protein